MSHSEALKRQVVTDGLTGVYNRRMFDRRLAEEVKRARRYDRDLALLMIDLDHGNALNTRYAHLSKALVKPGDLVFALPSTGLHTNGYSLARKILFEQDWFTKRCISEPEQVKTELIGQISAIVGKVQHELARNASQAFLGLHYCNGVVKGLEVANQVARIGRLKEPLGKVSFVVGGKLVANLGGQVNDRLRAKTTVEVVVQADLRELANVVVCHGVLSSP